MTQMRVGEVLAGQPQRICVTGDWHGSVTAAEAALRWAKAHGADVVLQVGDYGFGMDHGTQHDGSFARRVPAVAAELALPLLWLPGNHENWGALSQIRSDQGLSDTDPWILTDWWAQLPNGYRLPWGTSGWLVLAGATSVDRPWRHLGWSWWPEEVQLTPAVVRRLVAAHAEVPVGVVVAHDAFWTAPSGSRRRPTGVLAERLHWRLPMAERLRRVPVMCTEDTLREADRHARQVRQVCDKVLAGGGVFIHGHMHLRYTDLHNGWTVEGLADHRSTPDDGLCILVDSDGHRIA